MKIPVGISSCLMGENVRYDGGNRFDLLIHETLGEVFEFVPFCPETAIGLGVPREPIRLVGDTDSDRIRCLSLDGTSDYTECLTQYALQQREPHSRLCGYVFKKGSPSCGVDSVKVWRRDQTLPTGTGIYAATLMKLYPWLPVEEEGRLHDTALRARFMQRVIALHQRRARRPKGCRDNNQGASE
ncbi:MAG: DUF523 domain-containing protein [Pseudohongiellaceae bacterium]